MAESLRAALERKSLIEGDLARLERQILDLESAYLEESGGFNIVRGYAGFEK